MTTWKTSRVVWRSCDDIKRSRVIWRSGDDMEEIESGVEVR